MTPEQTGGTIGHEALSTTIGDLVNRTLLLSATGALVMLGAILYGFATGDFGAEGGQLLDLAWGRVTLIDLYLSFAVFWAWVASRERTWATRLAWLVAIVTLGSLAICAYVALAALRSNGDRARLLLGSADLDRG